MLAGRTLMKKVKNKEKFVLATKLLEDNSGVKVGKTEGDMASLSDDPAEMFGKIMSWNDGLILIGFELLTEISDKGIELFADSLKKGENPRDIKFKLAQEIVTQYHGLDMALLAGEAFNKQFRDHEKPLDIEVKKVSQKMMGIIDLVFELGLSSSKGEARRLIEQGGVKIDDSKITDVKEVLGIHDGMIVQVGKRKFVKIKM
jgi:tyrosyl-tRNA synthetase